MTDSTRICAGIVSYNPDIDLLEKVISSVESQVEHIFIYDNSSNNIGYIKEIIEGKDAITLIESDRNDGIAKALNIVCDRALKDGFNWILTLDHDTILEYNMIDSFKQLLANEELRIGIVCPRVKYVNYHTAEKGRVSTRYEIVQGCMTSGSCMSLEAWKQIGGFDEKMLIDWVDNDICLRLRVAGRQIVRDNQRFMHHNLGNPKKKRILLWHMTDFSYSEFRIYHIVRNEIYYYRKNKKYINRIKQKLIILDTIVRFYMLNHGDKKKMEAIRKGIADGLHMSIENKTGGDET